MHRVIGSSLGASQPRRHTHSMQATTSSSLIVSPERFCAVCLSHSDTRTHTLSNTQSLSHWLTVLVHAQTDEQTDTCLAIKCRQIYVPTAVSTSPTISLVLRVRLAGFHPHPPMQLFISLLGTDTDTQRHGTETQTQRHREQTDLQKH